MQPTSSPAETPSAESSTPVTSSTPQPVLQRTLPDLASQVSYSAERFQSKMVLDRAGQNSLVFAFAQGQELKRHTTPQEALLVVLEGEASFQLPDEGSAQTLKAEQVIQIPAHVPHALVALTNFKMVLVK